MNTDKCFCHFNGFEVKDAFAREKLIGLEINVENAFQEAANVSGTAANALAAAQNAETIANDAHAYAMNAENASLAAVRDAEEALDTAQNISGLLIESLEHPGCFYRNIDGEIEWINPPMVLGTEYRTTERFNGAPVYIFSLRVVHDPTGQSETDTHRLFDVHLPEEVIISHYNIIDFYGKTYTPEQIISINNSINSLNESYDGISFFYESGFILSVPVEMTDALYGDYRSVIIIKYYKGDSDI